jgi:hypothetical protein
VSNRDLAFNVRQLTSTTSVNPDHVVYAHIKRSLRTAEAGPTSWQIEITTTAGGNPLIVEDSENGFTELAKQLQLDIPAAPYVLGPSLSD